MKNLDRRSALALLGLTLGAVAYAVPKLTLISTAHAEGNGNSCPSGGENGGSDPTGPTSPTQPSEPEPSEPSEPTPPPEPSRPSKPEREPKERRPDREPNDCAKRVGTPDCDKR